MFSILNAQLHSLNEIYPKINLISLIIFQIYFNKLQFL